MLRRTPGTCIQPPPCPSLSYTVRTHTARLALRASAAGRRERREAGALRAKAELRPLAPALAPLGGAFAGRVGDWTGATRLTYHAPAEREHAGSGSAARILAPGEGSFSVRAPRAPPPCFPDASKRYESRKADIRFRVAHTMLHEKSLGNLACRYRYVVRFYTEADERCDTSAHCPSFGRSLA